MEMKELWLWQKILQKISHLLKTNSKGNLTLKIIFIKRNLQNSNHNF